MSGDLKILYHLKCGDKRGWSLAEMLISYREYKEARMSRSRQLEEVHFICHQGRQVVDQNDGTFLTSFWVIAPEHIRPGLVFALHETKAEASYLQGVVLEVTRIREETKPSGRSLRRVELRVRETPVPLPWRGSGSGEKGFVWS